MQMSIYNNMESQFHSLCTCTHWPHSSAQIFATCGVKLT